MRRRNTVVNNLRFPGQYYDAETSLHYNWNRYYDPNIGRYITGDPIGLEGGVNLFSYVGGNPVNFVDPWGLSSTDVVSWANQQISSHAYSLWSPNSEVRGGRGTLFGGRFSPKCNIFVYDALQAGNCETGRVDGGRVPRATEWANPNFNIPGCSVVSTPEPGDVVAYGGHVGIYYPYTTQLKGTISAASPSPVVWSNWGFCAGQSPTFRRCKCK